MSRFTHFFRRFFVTEKQTPQTFPLLESMDDGDENGHENCEYDDQKDGNICNIEKDNHPDTCSYF